MNVRKLVTLVQETHAEGGESLDSPATVAFAGAVIANPWAGRGFVEDLSPEINDHAPRLAALIVPRLLALLDGPAEAYGKAAIVGVNGDIEHGSGLIHTLQFGNPFRDAVAGTTLLPAVEKRAAAGTVFDIPLKHITDMTIRSHHQTLEVRIADAPHPDEILVGLAAATGGRPHARLREFGSDPS
ncbi:MAG TPA: amino acid synthesis family protein [Solirubrobacteraceae bacterium]|nr:amino acid synthesis family protein [Solirubrobacteraceae bacterium]